MDKDEGINDLHSAPSVNLLADQTDEAIENTSSVTNINTATDNNSLHKNSITTTANNKNNSKIIKSGMLSEPIEMAKLSKDLLSKIGQGDCPEIGPQEARPSRPKITPFPRPPISEGSSSSSSQIKVQKKQEKSGKSHDATEPKFHLSNNSDDIKLIEHADSEENEDVGIQIKIGKTSSVPKQSSSCTGKTRKEKTNKRTKKRKGKNFMKQLAKYSPNGGRKVKNKHRSKSRSSAPTPRSSSSQICSSGSSGRVSSSSSGRITTSSSQNVLKSSSSNIIEKNSRKKQNKSEKSNNKLAAPSKVVTKVVKYRKKRKDNRCLQNLHILTKSVFRTKVDSQNSSVEAIPYDWLEETESETEFKSALENNSRTQRFDKSEIYSENSLIGKSIIYHKDDDSKGTIVPKSADCLNSDISSKSNDTTSGSTDQLSSCNSGIESVIENLIPFESIKAEITNNFADNIFDLDHPLGINITENDNNEDNNSYNSNIYMSY